MTRPSALENVWMSVHPLPQVGQFHAAWEHSFFAVVCLHFLLICLFDYFLNSFGLERHIVCNPSDLTSEKMSFGAVEFRICDDECIEVSSE